MAGVTAAATGAIARAAFVLGRRAIFDAWTSVIAVATLIVLLKVKNVPEPLVIVATGFLGFACGAGELFIEFSDRGCTMAELCSRSHVSS